MLDSIIPIGILNNKFKITFNFCNKKLYFCLIFIKFGHNAFYDTNPTRVTNYFKKGFSDFFINKLCVLFFKFIYHFFNEMTTIDILELINNKKKSY